MVAARVRTFPNAKRSSSLMIREIAELSDLGQDGLGRRFGVIADLRDLIERLVCLLNLLDCLAHDHLVSVLQALQECLERTGLISATGRDWLPSGLGRLYNRLWHGNNERDGR